MIPPAVYAFPVSERNPMGQICKPSSAHTSHLGPIPNLLSCHPFKVQYHNILKKEQILRNCTYFFCLDFFFCFCFFLKLYLEYAGIFWLFFFFLINNEDTDILLVCVCVWGVLVKLKIISTRQPAMMNCDTLLRKGEGSSQYSHCSQ